ncbi:acyl-CoA dehydratase activase-related protein, partial [Gordonibacter urolithinfaciens]|uniref:acyl-CoA dehydratase activase-related protein n=1 Tax=Gordonibacter urolithinfaciens TaxID=1335613 RepID=UPI0012EDF403
LERRLLERCGDVAGDARRGGVRVGLLAALNGYESLSFWHALLRDLGFSVLVALRDGEEPSAEGLETIPSESVCRPAKIVHARLHALARRGADAVLMPRYARGSRCPVSSGYADAVRDSVPLVADGTVALAAPLLAAVSPEKIAAGEADRAALRAALDALAPAGASASNAARS